MTDIFYVLVVLGFFGVAILTVTRAFSKVKP